MTNPFTNGADIIDGLLMLGLLAVAISAFVMSRKASDSWFDDIFTKH